MCAIGRNRYRHMCRPPIQQIRGGGLRHASPNRNCCVLIAHLYIDLLGPTSCSSSPAEDEREAEARQENEIRGYREGLSNTNPHLSEHYNDLEEQQPVIWSFCEERNPADCGG